MIRSPDSNHTEFLEILLASARMASPIPGLEALLARLEGWE
ncbi:hypothetical protein MCELHM10_03793 [Paracoccaceae bacterium]|jgi:hypothetical protein